MAIFNSVREKGATNLEYPVNVLDKGSDVAHREIGVDVLVSTSSLQYSAATLSLEPTRKTDRARNGSNSCTGFFKFRMTSQGSDTGL